VPERAVIDVEKCIASGMCEAIAPELFELGDREHAVVLEHSEPTAEEAEAMRSAVECCPVEAIAIQGVG
jgi:ferredoxin